MAPKSFGLREYLAGGLTRAHFPIGSVEACCSDQIQTMQELKFNNSMHLPKELMVYGDGSFHYFG